MKSVTEDAAIAETLAAIRERTGKAIFFASRSTGKVPLVLRDCEYLLGVVAELREKRKD